jgi:hypothetical protein
MTLSNASCLRSGALSSCVYILHLRRPVHTTCKTVHKGSKTTVGDSASFSTVLVGLSPHLFFSGCKIRTAVAALVFLFQTSRVAANVVTSHQKSTQWTVSRVVCVLSLGVSRVCAQNAKTTILQQFRSETISAQPLYRWNPTAH